MEGLSRRFHTAEYFDQAQTGNYFLLPARFLQLSDDRYVMTNEVGEYQTISRHDLQRYVRHELQSSERLYADLKGKHFLYDDDSSVALDLLALKYRSRTQRISDFTSLHLFVATLRCDYSCPYCQVSRQTDDKTTFDMSFETADKSLDLVFKSPSPNIKIEFQGGEPTLNLPLIKYVVEQAIRRNEFEKRNLGFIIATNLSFINDEVLLLCERYSIDLSTSLDGPADLHNKNRPRPGKNGHQLVIDNLGKVRRALGPNRISALMTTTEASLHRVRDIIDTYLEHGFDGIFLRPLSPYGFAVKTKQAYRYDTERWLEFYREGLDYILELNKQGIHFVEYYTRLLLDKIYSPFGTGYVDLQSPTGAGISAIVYNYDGRVFASDEGRMLAEMGDDSFLMGNVHEHTYEEMFLGDDYLSMVEGSLAESSPMCSECAYLPYCGTDPVYHHATQKDLVGHKAFSGFCTKNMGMLNYVIKLLEDDPSARKVFMEWMK